MLLMLIVSLGATSQTKRTTLSQWGNTAQSMEHIQSIEGRDTSTYYVFGYRNMEYTHISDYGSIVFITRADVQEFIDALTEAETNLGTDADVTWDQNPKYRVQVYSFDKNAVYVYNDEKKWTKVWYKSIIKLIEWFKIN